MILGLRTVAYHVDDLAKAKDWYTKIVGHGPYFNQPSNATDALDRLGIIENPNFDAKKVG